jgi:hypothetical protein
MPKGVEQRETGRHNRIVTREELMRWFTVAGLAALAVIAAISNVSARTAEQWQPLILTPDELGTGFTTRVDRLLEGGDGYTRTMIRGGIVDGRPSVLSAIIILTDAPISARGAGDAAASALRSPSSGSSYSVGAASAAPGFEPDGISYPVTGTTSGELTVGSIFAWTTGDVVAVVSVLSAGRATAESTAALRQFPERQRDKLRAGLGTSRSQALTQTPLATIPVVADAPYRGILNCDSFTHQEAAQTVLLAFPGDPYGLDSDGNGLACEELMFLSNAEPIRSLAPASASEPAPAMTIAPPPLPLAAPLGVIFEGRGSGESETDNFRVTGRVEVCWEVSGRSPSGALGSEASFYFYQSGRPASTNSVTSKTGTGCQFLNLPAGTYYIKVLATSWSNWRVTVRAA